MDRDGGRLIHKREGMPIESPRGVQRGDTLWVLMQTHISYFCYHFGKNF